MMVGLRSVVVAIVLAGCGSPTQVAIDAADPPADAHVPSFGAAVTLSDPANISVVPVIACHGDRIVVAWHDFPAAGGPTRVLTRAIVDGIPGAIVVVPETLVGPKWPAIVATTSGFVLAWAATDNGTSVIRSIDLDADGQPIGAPVTISATGAAGLIPQVAAYGDDVVWAWTDGTAHLFARRGPVETVAATPVGTTLLSGGIQNYPRVAITSTGVVLLAYRDGATTSAYEVQLMIRQVGGAFAGPLDVSRSTDLSSDDIGLAIEPDDTLDIAWVDQDPVNANAFEVTHATRTPAGLVGAPGRFGSQNDWSWTPSVTPGLVTAWYTGMSFLGGPMWFANGPTSPPEPILAGEQASAIGLARCADDSRHLAYSTTSTPREVRYSTRR
jgi:hypothetical protein